jgi:spore coat protein U-like protein
VKSSVRVLIALASAVLFLPGPVAAATATSTFQVQITITDSCQINSATNIDFGSVGLLAADVDATGTVTVLCTLQVPFTIGLDVGSGSGATVAARKMSSPSNATVTYSLYRDAARLLVWGNTIGTDTLAGTGTGVAVPFTVYGRVPAQTTPAAGIYTDTITVTVTF